MARITKEPLYAPYNIIVIFSLTLQFSNVFFLIIHMILNGRKLIQILRRSQHTKMNYNLQTLVKFFNPIAIN